MDVASGDRRTVFSTSGPNPEVAGWSEDSGWVLFFGAPLGSKTTAAAGRALDAVPATGGPWRNVWDSMLPFRDFVAPCGRFLAVVEGGKRLVSQGKQILLTGPPTWKFRNLTNDYLRSWAWPACSPDGRWLAATAMPNRTEPRFPSGVRSLRVIATDGSRRARIDAPQLGALETPRWSADGRSLLVVERTKDDWGAPGTLLLVQVNPETGKEVQRADLEVDLGPAPGPGGHQQWSETTDWYRPPP
jgi:Tol biopolymer transport system component